MDEIDIVEELAQHVEDRYTDLRSGGAKEDEALGASLEELDGDTLTAELVEVVVKKSTKAG
jgi:hypothetical protein